MITKRGILSSIALVAFFLLVPLSAFADVVVTMPTCSSDVSYLPPSMGGSGNPNTSRGYEAIEGDSNWASFLAGLPTSFSVNADDVGGTYDFCTSNAWNPAGSFSAGFDLNSIFGSVPNGNYYIALGTVLYQYPAATAQTYGNVYYKIVVSGGSGTVNPVTPPPSDTSTRFISLTPSLNADVSTTTTAGAEVYVNANDYATGTILDLQFTNQTQSTSLSYSALDAFNAATGFANLEVQIPITASGDNTYSTSTTFNFPGLTFESASIETPSTNPLSWLPIVGQFFSSPSVLVATSSQFVVGTTTALDRAIQIGQSSVAYYSLTGIVSTSSALETACTPGSSGFSVVACFTNLIIPSGPQMGTAITSAANGFLARYPWGYATRFLFLLASSTATTSPPYPSIDLGGLASTLNVPGLSGVVSFDPWSAFSSTSVLSTVTSPDGTSWITVFLELWNIIVLGLFAWGVTHMILDFGQTYQVDTSENDENVV